MAEKKDVKVKDDKKEPKKPSYQTVIKQMMNDNKGVVTRDALLKATGADSKNLSVAVSILKNPDRIKEPMNVVYLRGNTTFYNLDNAAGKKAYDAALKMLEDQKAATKKAQAAEKKDAKADKKAA
jgi:hypothetical protein